MSLKKYEKGKKLKFPCRICGEYNCHTPHQKLEAKKKYVEKYVQQPESKNPTEKYILDTWDQFITFEKAQASHIPTKPQYHTTVSNGGYITVQVSRPRNIISYDIKDFKFSIDLELDLESDYF